MFYFFRASVIGFTLAHYIRSIHLGLQFSTTLVCEDGCRASVIGFTLAHYINKTSKGRFFSYYFVHYTNLSVNQSQSVRTRFDVRRRVSVIDVLRFLFSHLSAKIGGF